MAARTRRYLTLAALTALCLGIGSCGRELTGPVAGATTGLVLRPHFANALAASIVQLGWVRVVLTHPTDANIVVVDTTFPFPAAADSIVAEIAVPMTAAQQTFGLRAALTNAAGDTVFRLGPVPVVATSGASPPPPTPLPAPTYVGVGANAAGVRFVAPPATARFAQSLTLVAEAFDGSGATIAGTPIGFELVTRADTVRARFASVSSGTLTTGLVRGPVQLRAYLLTGQSVTHTLTVIPDPAVLQVVSGNAQVGTVAAPLAQPLVARVLGADSLALSGAIVEYRYLSGALVATTARDTSGADGLVSFAPTLANVAGPYTVTLVVVGFESVATAFTATAAAAAAVRLAFAVEPSEAEIDSPIMPPVVVRAFDQFANTATQFSGPVTLSLLDNPGTATLGGTTTVAALGGDATFADLALDVISTGYTLLATSGTLAADTSASFDVVPRSGLVTWINPGGGLWSSGANWSRGTPPTAADTAIITLDGTYTVTLDQVVTVSQLLLGGSNGIQSLSQSADSLIIVDNALIGANGRLVLQGGTLAGGLIVNNGTLAWSAGGLGGTTQLLNAGAATLTGAGTKTLLAGAVLENAGSLVVSGTGSLVLGLGSVIDNLAPGLIDIQSDADINWASGTAPEPFVLNAGVVRKSGGTGQSYIDQLANLGGTLEVLAGELELSSYTGTTNVSTGGTFLVAPGTVLDLISDAGSSYNAPTFTGSYTGSGGGFVLVDNGTLNLGGGASFDFPAAMLQLTGVTITNGLMVNLGRLSWFGGTLAASTTLHNLGTLVLPGTATKTLAADAVLINDDSLVISGTGELAMLVGSRIENGVGALLDIQTDADIDWTSGSAPEPRVVNEGTLRKSGGVGTTSIDQLANLGGTLDVLTGELELNSFAGTTNVSTGGTFNVAAGATLDLTSEQGTSYDDTFLTGSYSGAGGGTVLLDNGVLNVGTGATFTFPEGMLQWRAGTIAGGPFTNAGALTATGDSAKLVAAGAAFINQGALTIVMDTVDINGAWSDVEGAVLSGSGTLDLGNATVAPLAGTIRPGGTFGVFTLIAPAGLALGASARVELDLAGATAPGVDFDQLRVLGQTLALGGTIVVTNVGAYVPAGTETWALVTGVTGSFGTVQLPPATPFVLVLNAGTLFLTPP